MYKTEKINGEGPKWGHKAGGEEPFMAVGNFVNIIHVIEDLKANLPNVKPLKT